MVEIINKDYTDFVSLSTNLVDLDKVRVRACVGDAWNIDSHTKKRAGWLKHASAHARAGGIYSVICERGVG